MAAGFLSWICFVLFLLPEVDGQIWDAIYIGSVPAFICSLLAMIVVSLVTQRVYPAGPIMDFDGQNISDTKRFRWR